MTNTASALAKRNVKKVIMDGMNVIVKRLVISVKENTRELRFYIHIEYEYGIKRLKCFQNIKLYWI